MARTGVVFTLVAFEILFGLTPSNALVWTLKHGEGSTRLDALSATRLHFNLASIDVAKASDGAVSLRVPSWPTLGIPGEPDLPILRRAMLLPRGMDGPWRVEVRDVHTEVFTLAQFGQRVQHSQGRQSMCSGKNHTVFPTAAAYQGVYPVGGAKVSLAPPHVWRDVQGIVVEVRPIAVDHDKSMVQVMHSCTIDLVSDGTQATATQPLVIDRDFYGAYSFVYGNWEHYANDFIAADNPGRVLVVYDSQFEPQARKYADLVKQRSQEAVLYEAGQSSSIIKDRIASHYKEAAGLSYVVIIGRDVPTPHGSQTGKECDNCYAMLSGGLSLDVYVGRLSSESASGIETQLSKFQAYDASSTSAWNTRAHGSAFNLAGDEYSTMTSIMGNLGGMGFSEHSWEHGSSASARGLFAEMNKGLGVFSYLGHGQGDAWDTPMMQESGIHSLTNHDMPFFEIDVSCDNGAFQTYSPCMGEALLTAPGGAIATMMHAPEARGTMCKHYMVQASKVLSSGKADRVGPVYFAALQAAQVQDPDEYAVQAYNVFGDPTLQLAFASKPSRSAVIV